MVKAKCPQCQEPREWLSQEMKTSTVSYYCEQCKIFFTVKRDGKAP